MEKDMRTPKVPAPEHQSPVTPAPDHSRSPTVPAPKAPERKK